MPRACCATAIGTHWMMPNDLDLTNPSRAGDDVRCRKTEVAGAGAQPLASPGVPLSGDVEEVRRLDLRTLRRAGEEASVGSGAPRVSCAAKRGVATACAGHGAEPDGRRLGHV